jgi:hypothetical protein
MDKINKAAALSIVFFSIVLAGFVGARVDQTTIALLGGTFIGLLVAIPTTALIVLIVMRRREDIVSERTPRYSAPMPPNPPQYWVASNQPHDVRGQVYQPPAPQLREPIAAPEFMLPAARRRFYMIGESGEVREIEAPQSADGDPYFDDETRF